MLEYIKKIFFLDLRKEKIFDKAALKFLIINVLLFAVPLIIGEPQILIGSIVNFFLIYIALNFKESKLLPAIFLPATASLLRNVLLGSLTPYLAILLPFIWAANSLFIMAIRGMLNKTHKLGLSLVSAAVLKALFLFLITLILVGTLHFPAIFLTAMGILQLITAGIACFTYLLISKFK